MAGRVFFATLLDQQRSYKCCYIPGARTVLTITKTDPLPDPQPVGSRSPAPVLSLGIVPHILRFTRWSSVFLGRSSKTHKNEVFLITNKMPWSARDDGLRGPRKGENTAHGCENALRSLSQLLVALWPWASHFTCLGKRR